jgi:hypothetical protein
MGYFDKYFTGKVQNPAIAAATAIIISLLVSLTVHFSTRNKASV